MPRLGPGGASPRPALRLALQPRDGLRFLVYLPVQRTVFSDW